MSNYRVGVYYFPNYHVDARNELVHGPGWSEWELVKLARPRFPGHDQPKVPAWGYTDEADPVQMAQKIDAAADAGIDHFIFDWYWYDDGPFLQRGLDEGFLGAANCDRLGLGLMWANHDWKQIHPAKLRDPGRVLYPGVVTPETFAVIVDHVIERYFLHPSYLLVDGCPYFSIYELTKLTASFGGLRGTVEALALFRERTRAAGFPDLHLNAVLWGRPILPGETAPADPAGLLADLGFDSFTSYVWIHHVSPSSQFPVTPYTFCRDRYLDYWAEIVEQVNLPYIPNATMGWDSSPRTVQSDIFSDAGYPWTGVLGDNTPEAFAAALRQIKARLDAAGGGPGLVSINAWNEWTEGSYLEPDTVRGSGYLDAIREVFGPAPRSR